MWGLNSFFQVKVLAPLAKLLQLTVITTTSILIPNTNYPHSHVTDGHEFDFVVVGGGTAGCVLANRLTEVGTWSVLLIEAGDDPPYVSEIPGLSVLLSPSYPDWNYHTVRDNYSSKAQKTRSIRTTQGKMLGGSSGVNFMYYVRGNRDDFQDWVSRGNEGWDWQTVAEYFKKIERLNDPEILRSDISSLHGTSGYLGVSRRHNGENIESYFEAFKENGRDIIMDINGLQQLGYSTPCFAIDDKKRQSAALAYIAPIRERENLSIMKNTVARKIIFDDNKRAVAVEVEEQGRDIKTFRARKEIIVSAGAINSPKLLMLSGIGPAEHLSELGIKTLINAPKVGANLQDHMLVPIIITEENKSSSFLDSFKPLTTFDHFPAPAIMGHVAINKNQTYPDYQVSAFSLAKGSLLSILMCSNVFGWNDDICWALSESTKSHTFFSLIAFLHPKSRGKIRLKSNNPNDQALIYSGYLSNDEDLKKFARCLEDYISVLNTTYFRSMNSKIVDLNVEQCRNIPFASKTYWECYILNLVASQFHYSGTVAMGDDYVLDETLKVKGVNKLRVVDASVMPTVVSGNTEATVLMIAEKASDMIKIDNGMWIFEKENPIQKGAI